MLNKYKSEGALELGFFRNRAFRSKGVIELGCDNWGKLELGFIRVKVD